MPIHAMNLDQTISEHPVCLRCGKCCRYGPSINASHEDLIRWIRDERPDILHFFEAYCSDGTYVNCTELINTNAISCVLWTDMINPKTGDYYTDCPFLRSSEGDTWFCAIHLTRPAICVRFRPWEWGVKGLFFACPLVDKINVCGSDSSPPNYHEKDYC
ncbi:MAG: hypothetical protein CVV33_03900, partial [Methanomicrobiales archaeon HGW-Methanomicrobiales-4]